MIVLGDADDFTFLLCFGADEGEPGEDFTEINNLTKPRGIGGGNRLPG